MERRERGSMRRLGTGGVGFENKGWGGESNGNVCSSEQGKK